MLLYDLRVLEFNMAKYEDEMLLAEKILTYCPGPQSNGLIGSIRKIEKEIETVIKKSEFSNEK